MKSMAKQKSKFDGIAKLYIEHLFEDVLETTKKIQEAKTPVKVKIEVKKVVKEIQKKKIKTDHLI